MRARVAAIDCGTNTIKLLIGALPDVDVREMRMVRLGQDLDRTGVIADAALERAFGAIDEYAELIRSYDVPPERVRFVATSATRDAANAAVFVAGVRERLGVEPEVVSGEEEAALAFDGALRNLKHTPTGPVLVVDIGGGSTELILGRTGPEASVSMDIGSVRLHERHLHADPPTAGQVAACRADIDAHLDAAGVDPTAATTVIGVAGTVTQLAAVALDLPAYDRAAVDQAVLPTGLVLATVDLLLSMSHDSRRSIPSMHPGRADVIGAGVLILGQVLQRAGAAELVVSESDILDGIAWSLTR
ncbi:Ppx/GppA phosphatase family protein [Nocardioides sp. SR21]|uniref:Ppx/GppA phosphatase family protein n=1 Tax=Nocardioides sp. SR21 TaxID=2919501 RepID=UPI001FAAE313|nr:Ppx/GppA phosphatase family protein [Nocardioides sp. SR21]